MYCAAEVQCPAMCSNGSVWVLEWEGGPQQQLLCAPAEPIYVEGLSGGMLPSSLWHCGFPFFPTWPDRLGTYFPVPGKPRGFLSSEIRYVRGLALSAHKKSGVSWKTWAKHVCRFAYTIQTVVLAKHHGESPPFAARGRKFFHQDCCSAFLKCSSTLLGFSWCDPYKGVIWHRPNCWRWAGRIFRCMPAL